MGDKKILQKTYRLLIEAVYAKWNAEKYNDVPGLMEKYEDQEGEIYDRIVRKYVFCRPQKDWQPLVEAMYARFNPSKLTSLESIFEKYKDSEAALYRALCDKYLPTLEEHSSLLFNVWSQEGQGKAAQEEEASAEEADEEAPMQLASPSQEQEPEDEEAPMQLASPSQEQASPSQEQVPEQSAAEDMQEAAAASPAQAATSASLRELQAGAGDEPLPAAVAAKEGRRRKRRVQIAEDGSKVVVDRDRKRRRNERVEVGGDDAPPPVPVHTRGDAPPARADAPPPLPRRRKKDREAQQGAGDPPPDDFWHPQPAERRMSKETSSREVESTLRPKAAASRPPEATCFEHDTAPTGNQPVVRRRRVKVVDAQNGNSAMDGTPGKDPNRRRKRRRRVPADTAGAAVAATAHDATEQVPSASQQASSAPVPVLNPERMQQLKEKLTALKTQLSQQPRLRIEQRENTESGTYSDYSDEEDAQQAGHLGGHGTEQVRNGREAELRTKLLQSTLRKATGNVEPT
eukprot:TRINITY_DN26193_c0_g1_i2.p1 TRINITY_DN26193_c0_g1~~TRINITY_DN26193_c0_g1_i2.p1  ORF type:complete len:516 (-),score=147.22 TRINITY_DN26193_c0_g1_i2:85-1632(-)